MAAFEDDTKVKVSAITCGDGGIPETMASLEKQKRIEVQISKGKRGTTGEFVMSGESGEELLSGRGNDSNSFPRIGGATLGRSESMEHGTRGRKIYPISMRRKGRQLQRPEESCYLVA
jgi:hypothetical protein